LSDWRRIVGVFLGLCLAAGALAFVERFRAAAPARNAGPLFSDCDGALRELVIHYVPAAAPIVERTYRQFLSQLPGDTTVHVVCPDRAAFDDLTGRVGPVACKLRPVLTGHAMTYWSRDRWIAFGPRGPGEPVTLLSPRAEAGGELWPQRAGDSRIGDDLALALGHDVVSERSALHFDGGDFVGDERTAFVASAVLRRNLQRTVQTSQELLELLSKKLQRRIVLLRDAPDHHVGMYMMTVGDGTVLVGDPGMAEALVRRPRGAAPAFCQAGGGDDFSEATQRRFDSVAAQCAAAGYRVVRIPIVPGRDGRTYLSYLNVITDQRDGRRIVYMPVYDHAPALNEAAAAVWRGLGYEVRPVDCSSAYVHFGSLRCLVNVLRRSSANTIL